MELSCLQRYKREGFTVKLMAILGYVEAFKDFEALDFMEKASFVIGRD